MANRVSQETVEVLHAPSTAARISQLAVEALVVVSDVAARVSQLAVEVLATPPEVDLPFIASVSQVFAPALRGDVAVPFISSATSVYALTLTGAATEVDVPFIASKTRAYGIFSLYADITGVGPGNGGELFQVRLNANGTTTTATLAADLSAEDTLVTLTGDSGFPSVPFAVTIDDETIYLIKVSAGVYRVRGRGMGNTTAATHTAGATVSWGDSYDQAIIAGSDIAHEFTADLNSTGSQTYIGWLMCFDSSQAYLSGSRYPMHVTELVGVFDTGAGVTGTNHTDGPQPNAICTTAAVSDDCPAALSNPARISSDIVAGDVAIVRFTNPEASVLDLGPRAVALQSWFGMKRVDASDVDVTLTDPNGIIVDTTGGEDTFTGSVNGEWDDPLGPGIAPDTGLPTAHDVPYTSVTLPGTDRNFTRTVEKGWPICVLAVRQGNRRIPYWESWDWHNYAYVYAGFGVDCTYAQLVINRNGVVFNSVPEVALPGTQDIDGPDAVWDDGTYHFAASWYVALWAGAYLISGPTIGGSPNPFLLGGPTPTPHVTFGPGGASVTGFDGGNPVEGGSGGGINPPGVQLFQAASV